MNRSQTVNRKLNYRQLWLVLVAAALWLGIAWGSAKFLRQQSMERRVNHANEVVEATAKRVTHWALHEYLSAQNAARYFASFQPIASIGRALANGGIDPLNKASLEASRQNLAQQAVAYMLIYEDALQLRLIGLANNGRELVRVVRGANGKISIVAEGDLQASGDRRYFQVALQQSDGEVYASPFELNQGQNEWPLRPTLRAALPVRNVSGEIFGVVVVNVLADTLLDLIGVSEHPGIQTLVTDADGHHLLHTEPGKSVSKRVSSTSATWPEEFTPLPGVLEERGLVPSSHQVVTRAPDGTELLEWTYKLIEKDALGEGGLMLRAMIPLKVLDAQAFNAIRMELLLVWFEKLLAVGMIAFLLLRGGREPVPLGKTKSSWVPGHALRLFGVEIPLTPALRQATWRLLLAMLLPVPFWGAVTLLAGQPVQHPYILMLIPVLLASWWGGLYAGLGATLLAVLGVLDLETPAVLDWTGIANLDLWAGATLLVTGTLITFTQENLEWRGVQLLEQQHRSMQRSALLVAQAPSALAMLDTESRFVATSARWNDLFDLGPDTDLMNRPYFEVDHDFSLDWRELLQRALAGETLGAREDRLARTDGSVMWANWECRPWHTVDGSIGGIIIAIEDVTPEVNKRHEAEVALRKSEEKFRGLLETAPDAVVITDSDGRIVLINRQAELLFGYSREELFQQPIEILVPSKLRRSHVDDRRHYLGNPKWRPMGENRELHARRNDGSEFPVEISLSPLSTEAGMLISSSIRDITARKEAEAARRESDLERIKALERLQELENRFLQDIEQEQQRIGRDLHDGLGPHLAAVGYAASFLAKELRQRDPSAAEKADQLREMVNGAISLTRQLARGIGPVQIDSGGLSLALEELAHTTSDLSDVSVSYVKDEKLTFKDAKASLQLYRIAQEAVNNAIKHGGSHNITILLRQSTDSLRLSVIDDGIGMSQSRDDPHGMGHESMKYRSDSLGGTLKIDSNPSGGTIISCEIPWRSAGPVLPPR